MRYSIPCILSIFLAGFAGVASQDTGLETSGGAWKRVYRPSDRSRYGSASNCGKFLWEDDSGSPSLAACQAACDAAEKHGCNTINYNDTLSACERCNLLVTDLVPVLGGLSFGAFTLADIRSVGTAHFLLLKLELQT
ncbi:hypothetical protein CYMTET_13250 [Cymbomonas tetramitiformis]|uniref:Apple domain-containing protein n=1 Tax=Cymbomonas tetramitiformis TaxID=36881 RepID=A0AAE0LB93_9CHLO|nr:hypothetical protein CYMTET_13250 [Cymbomonas tetramitiformis]